MKDRFLPVGSVVLLNGGSKKLMITGFCTVTSEDPDKMYDYCGCLYPEGIIRSDQNCVFDHDQIKKVFFVGYDSEEEVAFKKKLDVLLSNKESKESDHISSIEKLDDEIEKL